MLVLETKMATELVSNIKKFTILLFVNTKDDASDDWKSKLGKKLGFEACTGVELCWDECEYWALEVRTTTALDDNKVLKLPLDDDFCNVEEEIRFNDPVEPCCQEKLSHVSGLFAQ